MLAVGDTVEAVEGGALLGEGEPGALPLSFDLDRRQRDRDAAVVEMHVVGDDDALVRDDIVVERVVGMDGAALRAATRQLTAADAEVERMLVRPPFFRTVEPGS